MAYVEEETETAIPRVTMKVAVMAEVYFSTLSIHTAMERHLIISFTMVLSEV